MKNLKKIKIFLCLFVALCSTFLYACDFSNEPKTEFTTTGYVYVDSKPLEGVLIKNETMQVATTNELGYFSFSFIGSKTTIHAELNDYIFDKQSVVVTPTSNSVIFVATKIQNLNGAISLKQIEITPTSIVSFGDNFQYVNNSNNCLKVNNLYIQIGNKKYDAITKDTFLIKNKINKIAFDNDLSVDTNTKFSISFSLDAYFTAYKEEYSFVEEKTSVIQITEPQTNAMLDENNELKYSYFGVNSSNNKFSYTISFIFEYYPAI